ncbi:MAG: hypothetical protein Fur0044_08340 [Anaerolineae bacterium]
MAGPLIIKNNSKLDESNRFMLYYSVPTGGANLIEGYFKEGRHADVPLSKCHAAKQALFL